MSTGNRSLHMLRKSGGRRLVLLTAAILVPVLLCAASWWAFAGYTVFYIQTMSVYPTAREVWFAQTYGHGGTRTQTRYFITEASFDDVRSYYERLTAPIVTPQYGVDANNHQYYRTVFNPSGEPVPIVTYEFTGEPIDASANLHCYFRLRYNCVTVNLLDFGENESVDLPDPAWDLGLQPTSEPPELYGGRLIVYIYHING